MYKDLRGTNTFARHCTSLLWKDRACIQTMLRQATSRLLTVSHSSVKHAYWQILNLFMHSLMQDLTHTHSIMARLVIVKVRISRSFTNLLLFAI